MIKRLLIVIMIICFSANVKADEEKDFLLDSMTVHQAYKIQQEEYIDRHKYNSLSLFTRGFSIAAYTFLELRFSINPKQRVCFERAPRQVLSSLFRKFEDGKINGNDSFVGELSLEIMRCFD